MADWTHNGLLADLAAHLARPERMLWTDMQMGPAGSPRPDVYTMAKSFVKPNPIAYEVKVSGADFRSDMKSGKWLKYLAFSYGVIFAVPRGLAVKQDLPALAGLMVRSGTGWRTVKAPTLQPCELPAEVMLKLLINGVEREYSVARCRGQARYAEMDGLRSALGDRVADAVRDISAQEEYLEQLKNDAASIRQRHEDSRVATMEAARRQAILITANARGQHRKLLAVLGLAEDASDGKIEQAIARLKNQIERDPMVAELRVKISYARNAILAAGNIVGLDTDPEV